MEKQIVTAFSSDGYKQYGHKLISSYNAPFELITYTEQMELTLPKSIQREQMQIPGLKEFIDRHKNDARMTGKDVNNYGDKYRRKGYCFKFDAVKFCRMVYVMWDAAHQLNDGLMMWLDGDCVIRKRLPDNIFEQFLPDDCAYTYLGRSVKYTETGFIIFRLPEMLPVLDYWRNIYNYDRMTDYKEWHSAYLFDRAREKFPHLKGNNLTGRYKGHVIHKCDVGKYIDHLKGDRKRMKRSPEAMR